MLGLQAASVEQQRELWNTQVRLQHTEILFRELDFLNTAFASLSTAAALLAGFAFSGLALALEEPVTSLRATLALLCVITTAINLVALCAATFAAIFSVRLALRGMHGEDNVEQAVRQAREEYRLVLRVFVAGIVFFFASLGVAGFLQLGAVAASAGLAISAIGLGLVFFLFSRIDTRFNLRAAATLTAFHLGARAGGSGSRPCASWFGSPAERAPSGAGSLAGSALAPPYPDDSVSVCAQSDGSAGRWNREDSLRGPLLDGAGWRREHERERPSFGPFFGASAASGKAAAPRTPAAMPGGGSRWEASFSAPRSAGGYSHAESAGGGFGGGGAQAARPRAPHDEALRPTRDDGRRAHEAALREQSDGGGTDAGTHGDGQLEHPARSQPAPGCLVQ